MRAIVANADADRPAVRIASQPVEEWFYVHRVGQDNARVAYMDPRVTVSIEPTGLDRAEFEVTINSYNTTPGEIRLGSNGPIWDSSHGVQVAISLAGLDPDGEAIAAPGTLFDDSNMKWDIGRVGPHDLKTLRLPARRLSSAGVANGPACLTATIVNAVPPFERDAYRKSNDEATACLKEEPPQLFSEGEFDLWWLHDCVTSTDSPCEATGSVELYVKQSNGSYLKPESVIFHLPDLSNRQYDDHEDSVNDGQTVSWQTAKGVGESRLALSETHEDLAGSEWPEEYPDWRGDYTVSVIYRSVGDAKVHVREHARNRNWNGNALFKANPTDTRTRQWKASPIAIFFEVDALGTYTLTYEASVKQLIDTVYSEPYSDSGTYTFHVGPIAELEVRSGGQSPLADSEERAYTIVAKHNGPDDAPMVVVNLSNVPEGSRHILEEDGYFGTYAGGQNCANGLCDGTWTIGKLPLNHGIVRGYRTEFPTLTLIAPSDSPAAPITATISQAEPYSVCIENGGVDDVRPKPPNETACTAANGSWHATNYFDYIEENNSADIAALPGSGEGDSGTPQSVETIGTSAGTLIRWTEAEYLNLWPVVGYRIERTNGSVSTTVGDGIKGNLFLDEHPGEHPQYRVRSLNEWGVGSIWSERTGAPDAEPSVTVKPTQLVVERSGDASSADYTIVLDSPPAGEVKSVSIAISSSDAAKAAADRSTLVFTDANWNIPQTVTVTWQNAAATGDVTITHTVTGGGYDDVAAAPVTVTVRGMVLDVSPTSLTMSENGGTGEYTIALTSEPASDVFVDISIADSGVATVSPARLVFTRDNHATPQTVTVTGVDDDFLNTGGERATQISHRISGGGLPAVTLAGPEVTVTDDDRPELMPDKTSVTVTDENAGTATYKVKLTTRPESNVTITVSSDDTSVATVMPVTLTFTPSNWDDYQEVTVTAVDDSKDNPNNQRDTTISHTARGGGYDGQTAEVEVIVLDDDGTTATITFSGIPAAAGSNADTRISEYNGTSTMTIDLGRFFKQGEGVIPICLTGGARVGTHYEVSISGGDATLDMTDPQKPLIRFGENGARVVVLEFTGIVHGTTEGQGEKKLTVELCSEGGSDDIRDRSSVSFTGDAMPHTVSIMDGLLLTEGESFDIPVPGSADGWYVFVSHYSIGGTGNKGEQALPSEHTIAKTNTGFKVTAKDSGRSGDRLFDLVACNKGSDGCGSFRRVAAFAGGNDTVTVTIIDPVPDMPQKVSFGQSQDSTDAVPEISIVAGGDITEGGIASFTITANPAPSANGDVVVAVTQSGDFGVTVGPRTVVLGPSGTATFTVTTTDDSVDESDGSITVALSPSADYTVSATQGAATVAVADNDPPSEVSACVSDVLLSTVRYYYDANRDNPPNYGENWKRVLIAFGDV